MDLCPRRSRPGRLLAFSYKNGQRMYGTFGFVIAIVALVRSRRTSTGARQLGAPALAGGLRTQAIAAIAMIGDCAISVVGIQLAEASEPKFGELASCYPKSGTQVIETPCGSSNATLVGTDIKSNGDDCPADSDGYLERADKVTFLCLGIKP